MGFFYIQQHTVFIYGGKRMTHKSHAVCQMQYHPFAALHRYPDAKTAVWQMLRLPVFQFHIRFWKACDFTFHRIISAVCHTYPDWIL